MADIDLEKTVDDIIKGIVKPTCFQAFGKVITALPDGISAEDWLILLESKGGDIVKKCFKARVRASMKPKKI